MSGTTVELRDHRLALSGKEKRGWGRVSIPADANSADNEFYFVFDDPPPRRIVLVSENRDDTRALEIASSISPDGKSDGLVDVMSPEDVDSLILDDAALLVWQAELPQDSVAAMVNEYVGRGGQVIFFPPQGLSSGLADPDSKFLDVRWDKWVEANADKKVMVENWRGDQDLLAATRSGTGLPLGQLEIGGYATLEGEVTQLATVTGGKPLLARVSTPKGGVYFCTASPASDRSTLGKNGIVLYIVIQRAIESGLAQLGQTSQRIAGFVDEPSENWRQVSGPAEAISSEFAFQSGIYREDFEDQSQWLAINRSPQEDQRDIVEDAQLDGLFTGLEFSRVDDSAGSLSGIVREIWRVFLLLMIVAMLAEAILCIPRRSLGKKKEITAENLGFGKPPSATGEAV